MFVNPSPYILLSTRWATAQSIHHKSNWKKTHLPVKLYFLLLQRHSDVCNVCACLLFIHKIYNQSQHSMRLILILHWRDEFYYSGGHGMPKHKHGDKSWQQILGCSKHHEMRPWSVCDAVETSVQPRITSQSRKNRRLYGPKYLSATIIKETVMNDKVSRYKEWADETEAKRRRLLCWFHYIKGKTLQKWKKEAAFK